MSFKVVYIVAALSFAIWAPSARAADKPERTDKVEKCNTENIDYSKFNSQWGKALVDRVNGKPVQLENGETVSGDMSKLKANAKEFAESFGCPAPRNDDEIGYLYATVMISVACFESSWDPKNKFDERTAGGIKGAGNDAEANESRGLLQLTYKSDADSSNGFNAGCKAKSQVDMDNPLVNLTCGLAIISRQQMKTATSMKGYWSVLKDPKAEKVKAAVAKQCQANYQQVSAYGMTAGGRMPASYSGGYR